MDTWPDDVDLEWVMNGGHQRADDLEFTGRWSGSPTPPPEGQNNSTQPISGILFIGWLSISFRVIDTNGIKSVPRYVGPNLSGQFVFAFSSGCISTGVFTNRCNDGLFGYTTHCKSLAVPVLSLETRGGWHQTMSLNTWSNDKIKLELYWLVLNSFYRILITLQF